MLGPAGGVGGIWGSRGVRGHWEVVGAQSKQGVRGQQGV